MAHTNCFPKFGGMIAVSDVCKDRTGISDYMTNYKQFPKLAYTPKWKPEGTNYHKGILTCQPLPDPICKIMNDESFAHGPRYGVPSGGICPCVPDQERMRFESTYQGDFYDKHHNRVNRELAHLPGVRPCRELNKPCCAEIGMMTGPMCLHNTICMEPETCKPACEPGPRLRKEDLIKPGTDTADCPKCPIACPCYPCPPDGSNICEQCCPTEYPCKMHAGAAMPPRMYPIVMGAPRYVPNIRDPPKRPQFVVAGGSIEAPLQNQFPTKEAISQAQERLVEKLKAERCKCPPICIETTYRGDYKVPPFKEVPRYCSPEMICMARQKEAEYKCRGLPPGCMPEYCLDGGHPPDPRPMFDHLSTYQTDYLWNVFPRYNLAGGEIVPCPFELKPLCHPGIVHASDILPQRTEEKERWGENWECYPPHSMDQEICPCPCPPGPCC